MKGRRTAHPTTTPKSWVGCVEACLLFDKAHAICLTREREQGSYNLSATRTSYLDFHLLHMDTLNIFSIWSSYFYKNYLLINKYHFFFSSSVASCKPSLSCTRHPFLARLPAFRSSLPNSVDQHHCSFPHASIFSFLTSRSVTASNLGWSLCADARLWTLTLLALPSFQAKPPQPLRWFRPLSPCLSTLEGDCWYQFSVWL